MTLSQWISLSLICFLGAATPGPSLLVMIRIAMTSGRAEALIAAWCHGAAIGFYALLSLLFFSSAQALGGPWFWGVAVAGQLWLLYLGVTTLRTALVRQANPDAAPDLAARWYQGLIIGLFNPKIWLFFTAVFNPFVGQAEVSWTLALLPLVIDGLWYTLIALGVTQGNLAALLARIKQPMDVTLGCLLCALAVWSLTDSLPTLAGLFA